MQKDTTSKPKLTYSQLKEQLDLVMAKLQDETIDIDKAIELYKEGQKLIEALEKYLKNAQNTIKKIKVNNSQKNTI